MRMNSGSIAKEVLSSYETEHHPNWPIHNLGPWNMSIEVSGDRKIRRPTDFEALRIEKHLVGRLSAFFVATTSRETTFSPGISLGGQSSIPDQCFSKKWCKEAKSCCDQSDLTKWIEARSEPRSTFVGEPKNQSRFPHTLVYTKARKINPTEHFTTLEPRCWSTYNFQMSIFYI